MVGDGMYKFEINDSYGDGICCSYGQGDYAVSVDGKQIQVGGNFGRSTGVTFTVGTPTLSISSISGAFNSVKEYAFIPPAGTGNVSCSISGNNGDADLYVSFDDANTIGGTSGGDCVPFVAGSNESCAATRFPTIGNVLMVTIHAYEAYTGLTLTCQSS